MSLALTALYYLENKLSNFMKSCFKNYAALHTFALSASPVARSPPPGIPPSPRALYLAARWPVIPFSTTINNKLKPFSFIIKLPMRVIPISILNKTFLNLLFANN
ncbi:TPA: hypothetical protein MBN28_003231 [Klebsiella variicola]|nr:hypothetical protein CAY66_13325 [Klebsiella variicola]AYW19066.1 hypothetical protein DTA24_10675 [Klebsiella sp. P1CD1]HBQ8855600.1 hypothetical protein [Klebsiella variicola subsp. variicola]ELA0489024.1 hypothetical protein [Klebsiella variicola]ELY7231453.1 hypothetical protein [Klebsiella variicola]